MFVHKYVRQASEMGACQLGHAFSMLIVVSVVFVLWNQAILSMWYLIQ